MKERQTVQLVPVRGKPRDRTCIGTVLVLVRGLTSLSEAKYSGCFSCIVNGLDMLVAGQEKRGVGVGNRSPTGQYRSCCRNAAVKSEGEI